MAQDLQREYLRDARRRASAAEYFDAEESGDEQQDAAAAAAATGGAVGASDDDEVDPLDAFMKGIDAQVTQQQAAAPKQVADKPQVLRHEVDDAHSSYLEECTRVGPTTTTTVAVAAVVVVTALAVVPPMGLFSAFDWFFSDV